MAHGRRDFDLAASAKRERQRETLEAQSARDHAVLALAEAKRLAEEIAAACGAEVQRVVLFGSLARADVRSRQPDIDLAVWATPQAFLRAISLALTSEFPVHVIDPRTAASHLQESIGRDGVVLHGR